MLNQVPGRNCGAVKRSHVGAGLLAGLDPVGVPMLEQFVESCCPHEGLTLEKFVESYLPWGGLQTVTRKEMTSPSTGEEGATEAICDRLTIIPIAHLPAPLERR